MVILNFGFCQVLYIIILAFEAEMLNKMDAESFTEAKNMFDF